MIGKTEETGLHAVGEHNQRQRHDGIYVGHNAILRLGELECIERHQTPVEETPDYAADAVNRCILGEGFNTSHIF